MMREQKIYSKKEALTKMSLAAKKYESQLSGKKLLFVAKENKNLKCYEMTFMPVNFKHFTGMDSKESAINFYEALLSGQLKPANFDFKNKILTSMKLDVLEEAMSLPDSASMIGMYIGTRKELKADIGAGNVNCVMTFRFNNEETHKLYPVGVLKEDIRNVTVKEPIVAIFRKDKDASLYDEMTYKSKNINLDKLHIPKGIKTMLTPQVYNLLKPEKKD